MWNADVIGWSQVHVEFNTHKNKTVTDPAVNVSTNGMHHPQTK